ncbi:MAG TPA: helical backbone metal receptor, partial [Candidatus Acidoferrales bacterium]|nr:helical backbone metal receptor [Candidatus Acidoferrales bacterium]
VRVGLLTPILGHADTSASVRVGLLTPVLGHADTSASVRVVSLTPAFAEDLFAIGAGAQVVGVSQFTVVPQAARLPRIASFSWIASERIVRLHPDLVVGIPAQAALVADIARAGIHVLLLPNDSFDELFSDLQTLGILTGHRAQAYRLCAQLHARSLALARRVAGLPRPRVFVVLGVAPIYTVSDRSYIARLIELAGGTNAVTGTPEAYPRYSAEALVALQPDVIIADQAVGLASVLDRPPWNALTAVRTKHLFMIDDPAILLQPAARYNEGVAWLISRLHPHAARTAAAR